LAGWSSRGVKRVVDVHSSTLGGDFDVVDQHRKGPTRNTCESAQGDISGYSQTGHSPHSPG
jgi:hypothetical protein